VSSCILFWMNCSYIMTLVLASSRILALLISPQQGPSLVREPTLAAFLVPEILSPSPSERSAVVVELDGARAPVTFKQVFRKIWLFAVMLLLIYEVRLLI
jgi:hypothetical protein